MREIPRKVRVILWERFRRKRQYFRVFVLDSVFIGAEHRDFVDNQKRLCSQVQKANPFLKNQNSRKENIARSFITEQSLRRQEISDRKKRKAHHS